MVQFDNQYRQIKIKIVYYGPAHGGKTTCLQRIHQATDPQRRTKLYSLNTASDRTLFFDLMSLNLGRIRGYSLALQLYTVPGQVQYNATRRAVLSGADGVVFVADSQRDQREANVASLENLWENLEANGLDRGAVPIVFEYNKRDLDPLLSVAELDGDLNGNGAASFPTVAITGEGVMKAFAAISERTLEAVADRLGVGASERALDQLRQQVKEALRRFVDDQPRAETAADDVEVTTPEDSPQPDQALDQDALVGEAVRANVAMTDLNARLDTVSRQLERRVRVMAGISDFGRSVSGERDAADVLKLLLGRTVELLDVRAAAVLVVPGSGPLREERLQGLKQDPLLAAVDEAGEPLATALVNGREPELLARELDGSGESLNLAAVESAGFASAAVVPLLAQEQIVGLLTAYGGKDRAPLDEADLQLATVLGSTAAVAFTNAQAWRQLEEFNKGLEAQVAARTGELRESYAEARRLAKDLEEKHRLLDEAYRDLSEMDRLKDDLIGRISRELKVPVNSVATAAKLLDEQSDGGSSKDDRFVTIIREQSEKLSEIIGSVVQASMLASASDGHEPQQVPTEDLLRRAIAPLRDLAKQREVGLNILIPSGLKTVYCDAETTEAALRAVIKNAIEFNRQGGSVKLEVRRLTKGEEPWLMVKVIDDGVGIKNEDLPRVFETFFKGDNAPDERRRGVGLGLTIAKRIVENHGGAIAVSSRDSEGTEVTVSLPQREGD